MTSLLTTSLFTHKGNVWRDFFYHYFLILFIYFFFLGICDELGVLGQRVPGYDSSPRFLRQELIRRSVLLRPEWSVVSYFGILL